MMLAPAFLTLALVSAGGESVQDLMFLAEDRPIFVRLRATLGNRSLDDEWLATLKALYKLLDRDGDGTVTTKEADKDRVADLVRKLSGDAAPMFSGELDRPPNDGVVSMDELADALRPVLGPFRVQLGRLASGRTDALFDQLDRDKDEALTRNELAAIGGSLRRLDFDDNEMISFDELEPFNNRAAMAVAENASDRRARFTAAPPVVEMTAGESSLRFARLLFKKYDKGKDGAPGRPDGRLSHNEIAIADEAFAGADRNGDGQLDTEDVRRFLAAAPMDVVLDVAFGPNGGGPATVRAEGGGSAPKGVVIRQLGDGDVELVVGRDRLDVHVDDGERRADDARRLVLRQFQAADANKNGYLEGKELNPARFPLLAVPTLLDDGDGKLYTEEVRAFTERRIEVARSRVALTVSDQGRAIFGVLDLDRDRRLSAREIMRTVDRVTSWDADHDGRVTADEIPYHFLVTIARGVLAEPLADGPGAAPRALAAPTPAAPSAGPEWFRQMDRNRDGDVSRREFLGPREQFNRIDKDRDGLIDADEAGAVVH